MKIFGKKISNYNLCLSLILFLAILLRFYRFNDRWVIFADSARDVLVAREALKLGLAHWPLVGSFSSAGPFVFGPLFYWFLSFSYLPAINFLPLPWIVIGLISVIFVWVMGETGKKFGGPRMGLLLAFLAALSPAQNFRSLTLTQHTLIGISAAVALWAFINYLQKYQAKFLFLLGLSLGVALSMHYQAINLLLFGLAVLILPKFNLKKIAQNLIFFILGLLIPSLPLLYWDSLQGWANINNILDYFFIGQSRIYISHRWLTYVLQFWPQFWASIIGGTKFIGWIFIVGMLVLLGQKLLTKKLNKTVFFLLIIFISQVILLRYHKGEVFEGYIIYFHPLILFFSAWFLTNLWLEQRWLALSLVLAVSIFSLKNILFQIKINQNEIPALTKTVQQFKKSYPGKKFVLWDYKKAATAYSFTFTALLDSQNLIDEENGVPIGICYFSCPPEFPTNITKFQDSINFIDLSRTPKEQLQPPRWHKISPRLVFEDVALWWKKGKLKSTFSLKKYLLERIKLRL
jgi:hypothetical protein